MDEKMISEREMQYTHGHAEAVLRSHRWRTAANSAAYLLDRLRPGLSMLDVGCGPGTLTADLAARVAPGTVLGIDLSADVIAEAQRHAAARGLPSLHFERADVLQLAGGDRRFDVVHAHQVLQHVADPMATLRAMRALAGADGVVAARDADYSAMHWWPAEPALDRWLDIYRAVTRHLGGECDAGRRLLHWAHLAGLQDVELTTSTWTFAAAADLEWWCGLWADRVEGTRLAEQAVALGVADRAELAGIAAAWRDWGRRADAVFVVPHGEIVAR